MTKASGSLLPAPPHLERFRLGRVDDPGFFAWRPEHLLRLAHRDTPVGVTLHTEARVADPRRFDQLRFPPLGNAQRPQRRDPELAALARRWAGDRPCGWGQIEAVIHRLRIEYIRDDAARPPEDCADPLRHFLLVARRGPDYQFAGAAALLLRELGYPVRLASGCYVAPAHYDPQARTTPVVADDVHFWVEVRLPSGDWLVLEPTPGFDVLTLPVSWSERLAAYLAAAAWPLSVTALGLAGLWWRRRELLDRLGLVGWRWLPRRSWRQTVRRCVGLLERRCR